MRIPIRPEGRSLNLANAVAIGVYEAVRPVGEPDPERLSSLDLSGREHSSDGPYAAATSDQGASE